ncbi:FtsX-like permease family protein [Humibacter ginsenosidimutans]|uniref:FtsX-like permease family protein n=1 Tax=Humibacter ginsenosidimutans TaxID=2599293 RepID=A0A5B8M5N2_9MICO|nr:FtsX-like permease family protein [Humibacter ginsenosidimutans]QDZ15254.1 FtsX-like permease family protein [Humibacter ginsenosidimutans]
MSTIAVARLLARPTASGRAALVLPIVAFGIATALLLTTLAGAISFFRWHDSLGILYQALAVFASALLLVPLASLGGSAARLSARRRDDRLATLRLLGATTGFVARITVLESAALAVVGAVAGTLLYVVLTPLVGLIHFRGEAIGALALLLNPLIVLAVIIGVGLLAAVSAAIGLRGVIVSPLGVRTRQTAPKTRWVRLIVGVIVLGAVVFCVANPDVFGGSVAIIVVLTAAFVAANAVLGLVGPLVIRLFAKSGLRKAETPQRLIAARTVLESPKAAWRQVSGVSMTCFIAVFAGTALAMIGAVSGDRQEYDQLVLLADIRTGVYITLAISFVMVACSVGVSQASAILDRRDLYVSLDRLGMPVRTMNAARARAVLSPLRVVTIGSSVTAAVVVLPLAGVTLVLAPLSLLTIAASIAAGILVVALGVVATRPVLRRVLAEPATLAE